MLKEQIFKKANDELSKAESHIIFIQAKNQKKDIKNLMRLNEKLFESIGNWVPFKAVLN